MNAPSKVRVRTRAKPLANGEFQTDIEPNMVLDLEDIAKGWSEQSLMRPTLAKTMICDLESYILEELKKGNQLNFGLVTFYPRLSGTLPKRDSNPASEGLYVRGAVKARRSLMMGTKRSTVAVNVSSPIRTTIWGIDADIPSGKLYPLAAGEEIAIRGDSIPVVAGREDEGVWLEARRRGKVARARVTASEEQCVKAVFDELPEPGRYYLVIQTRCGRDETYSPIRCRIEVRVPRIAHGI